MAKHIVRNNIFVKKIAQYNFNIIRYCLGSNNNQRIFLNSIPKSGTHYLLAELLKYNLNDYYGFISSTPSFTLKLQSNNNIYKRLKKALNNEVICGHIFYQNEYIKLLESENFCNFFLYRDPRAIFISEYNYLKNMNKYHLIHRKYLSKISDRDLAFDLLFNGFEDTSNFYFPSFKKRISNYCKWINCKQNNLLCIKFEEFIQDKSSVQNKVLEHLFSNGFNVKIQSIPMKSHTFTNLDPDRWKYQLPKKWINLINKDLNEEIELMGYKI